MKGSYRIRLAPGKIARAELTIEEPGVAATLDWLGVPPEGRGKGLARRLMAEVLADADREGVTLTLVSHSCGQTADSPGQDRLTRFYESLGFEPTGEVSKEHHGPVMVRHPKGLL